MVREGRQWSEKTRKKKNDGREDNEHRETSEGGG